MITVLEEFVGVVLIGYTVPLRSETLNCLSPFPTNVEMLSALYNALHGRAAKQYHS